MKKIGFILAALLLILLGGLYWYVCVHTELIKSSLQQTVLEKSDSLYRLSYVSSDIDEVAGDVSFDHVQLKIDSTILKKLISAHLAPDILMDLTIKHIRIKGLKSTNLLSEESADANTITIESPVLRFFNRGINSRKKSIIDTSEIYERLLGHYKLIRADSILIRDGSFEWNENELQKQVSLEQIHCTIHHFLVDSIHQYKNIAAYFVKDAELQATNFKIKDSIASKNILFSKIEYKANEGVIEIKNVMIGDDQRIKNIRLAGLNTADFIYMNMIKCKSLLVDDIHLSLQKRQSNINKSDSLFISVPKMIGSVQVDTFTVSNGRFELANENTKTVELRGIEASLYNTRIDSNGISLRSILEDGLFKIDIKSAAIYPSGGIHTIEVHDVHYINSTRNLVVGVFKITPTIELNNPAKTGKTQQDLFTMVANNIHVDKFDPSRFVFMNEISAKAVSLSLDMRVFTDKFYGNNKESRIGQYPHQWLQKLKMKINIPILNFQNSYVEYKERKEQTGKVGKLFFSKANGKIVNFSNSTKGAIKLSMNGLLMNEGKVRTDWILPMNTKNGEFVVTALLEDFNLASMNDVSRNLAGIEVSSGHINQLEYNVKGTNNSSSGYVMFTYNDLKIKILKSDESLLVKNKKFLSLFANLMMKNSKENTNREPFTKERDSTKSLFNFLWKSAFEGVKNTVLTQSAKAIQPKRK